MGWVGWVTIQKIMPLRGLSCKLRLSRSSARLGFQDRPSVGILETNFCGGSGTVIIQVTQLKFRWTCQLELSLPIQTYWKHSSSETPSSVTSRKKLYLERSDPTWSYKCFGEGGLLNLGTEDYWFRGLLHCFHGSLQGWRSQNEVFSRVTGCKVTSNKFKGQKGHGSKRSQGEKVTGQKGNRCRSHRQNGEF